MAVGAKIVLAVACALISLSLHGCEKEFAQISENVKHWAGTTYNQLVQSTCELVVHDKLDDLLAAGEKRLEEKCIADDVLDDSQCVGWGIAQMITVQSDSKDKWTADCVKKADEALAAAHANIGSLGTFVSEWWKENEGALTAEITSFAGGAYESAAGAASQGIEAGIMWVCETAVEGGVATAVLEAQKLLESSCQSVALALQTACHSEGAKALGDLDSEEDLKYTAECVTNVENALKVSSDKFSELHAKLEQWWNANGDAIVADVQSKAQGIISQASTTGTVSRLYSDNRAFGMSGMPVLSLVAAIAAMLVLVVGAFALRSRRSRRVSYKAPADGEEEQEELE